MAMNPHYPNSQKSNFGTNDLYIVAHATRNVEPKHAGSYNLAPSSKSFKSQLHDQISENIRNCYDLTVSSKPGIRLPLNMIVSKTATRKTLQKEEENFIDKGNDDPLKGFNYREFGLLDPPLRDKEYNRKKLKSAHFHNKRKIEEIQAMKAKLNCPQYDPGDLAKRRRYHNLQHILPDSELCLRKEQHSSQEERFHQLYDGCQRLPQSKPLVMESEDSLLDNFSDANVRASEPKSNDKENLMFSSTPAFRPTKGKFIWNPVILPVASSFSSARELLEYHYPPRFDRNKTKEWFDSPGNRTTSSTSSDLTVAEETVRLTYYAGRCSIPLAEQCQLSGNYSSRGPSETTERSNCLPNFLYNFEE